MPDTPKWTDEPWCQVLRAKRNELGATKVSKLIGYSAPTVIEVCKGSYGADPKGVREAVEARLMAAEVRCPVLGVIPLDDCRTHRTAPFAVTNPLRVQLHRACQECPNNPNALDR
ncbi:MAG: transcriptional regulator [Bacteroidota bacterium]